MSKQIFGLFRVIFVPKSKVSQRRNSWSVEHENKILCKVFLLSWLIVWCLVCLQFGYHFGLYQSAVLVDLSTARFFVLRKCWWSNRLFPRMQLWQKSSPEDLSPFRRARHFFGLILINCRTIRKHSRLLSLLPQRILTLSPPIYLKLES